MHRFSTPQPWRLDDLPHPASHGIKLGRQAGGQPRGIIAQGEMLVAQHLKPAAFEQPIQIRAAKIRQMPGDVDATPALAQQQELPAGRVRYLDD
jgi:hypothetical protein